VFLTDFNGKDRENHFAYAAFATITVASS
jgi:hypothetical protein